MKEHKLLKKLSVSAIAGISALALFSATGIVSNSSNNAHAGENIAALLKKASHTHPKSTLHVSKRQAEIANGGMRYNEADYSKKQITEMEHGANANKMIPAKLPRNQKIRLMKQLHRHNKNYRINKHRKNRKSIKRNKHVKRTKHARKARTHRVKRNRIPNLAKANNYGKYEIKITRPTKLTYQKRSFAYGNKVLRTCWIHRGTILHLSGHNSVYDGPVYIVYGRHSFGNHGNKLSVITLTRHNYKFIK